MQPTNVPMRPLGKADHIDPVNAPAHLNCTHGAEANIKLFSKKEKVN